MGVYSWRFPKLDDGQEQGINDSGVATFKGSELYDNLAREICQNSLDAKADNQTTVIVEFNSISLPKRDHVALMGLDDVIKDCEQFWKKKTEPKFEAFVKEAKSKLSHDNIEFLVISDYNTVGLSGAKAGITERSVWRALTHSNGVTQKGQGSGGSYGIGKNAPFACSSFRTVFYNTYAQEDHVRAFQGVARLVTHFEAGEATQGVGFFQNVTTKKPIYEEDSCLLRDVFHRKEYGTDVIIAGFKKTLTWADDIEKAVLSNFFVAIVDKKLVVKIDGREINAQNIAGRLKHYTEIERRENIREKKITPIMELYSAFTDPDVVMSTKIIPADKTDDVKLYIKKNDEYSKIVAEMRSIGMVIRTRHNSQFTRYAAVMVVQPGKLNDLLKEIEPPQHNKWDPDIIEEDQDKINYAKRVKKALVRWTNDTIVECCRCEVPEEIDLDGVSAYLPFDDNDIGLGKDEKEDKSPNAENIPGEVKRSKQQVRTVKLTATKVKGHKDEDKTPANEQGGGNKPGTGGTPDPNGPDDVTAPTPGKKSIYVPKVLSQRIIQMPASSSYRVALVLENDCPAVHISVKAIGDDGNKESIVIKEYKLDNQKNSLDSDVLVLKNIKAKTQQEVYLYFEYSEKMLLELLVY